MENPEIIAIVSIRMPTSRPPSQMAWSCLLVTLLSMTPAMNRQAASTSTGMYLTRVR